MVTSFLIFICFSLKIILSKNLNQTKYFHQISNTEEDQERISQCIANLIKKQNTTASIVCVLEELRDNPKTAEVIIKAGLAARGYYLPSLLESSGMECLSDLLNEILDPYHAFVNDLLDVMKNHKELINNIIALIKAKEEGKNITNYELFQFIKNITNIEGMDKVFEHILNSPNNGGIFKLIGTKFLNGTIYAKLYNYLEEHDVINPHKNQILRLIYKMLKAGLFNRENKINNIAVVYILEFMRDNKQLVRVLFEKVKTFVDENDDFLVEFLRQTNTPSLYNLLKDICSNNSTFFANLTDIIQNHDEFLNDTIFIVNGTIHNNITKRQIFDKLKEIFNINGFKEVFIDKLKKYFFDIVELLPPNVGGKLTIVPLLKEMKGFIQKYQNDLIELIYRIMAHYLNYPEIIKDVQNFLSNVNKTELIKDLSSMISNKTFIAKIIPLINFDNEIVNTVVRKIIADEKLMKLGLNFIRDQNLVEKFVNIVLHLRDKDYLNTNLSPFLDDVIGGNKTVKNTIINSFKNVIRSTLTEQRLKSALSNVFSGVLKKLISTIDGIEKNISSTCVELFDHTYLNQPDNDKFRFYYTKKLLVDSTKSKNDFLTYENCLNGYDTTEYSTQYKNKYQIKPVFVMGKIYDRPNQNKLKNSSYFEKYNYMISFCFPQGKSNYTNETLCNDEDYKTLIKIFNSFVNSVDNVNIRVFSIYEEDLKGKPRHFIYFSLIIIISAIPLLIWIFLIIYKNIKIFKLQKNEINNDLISENKNINKKTKKLYEIQKRELSFRKFAPKWFKYLNEYFDLAKNGSELFNFTLNQTNFNDFNGITYIKGILGISMILNIFGVTFLIVANSLTKMLGSYQFYDSLNDPLYFVAFIALRYSPRIIFSCSGYTLIYKFLNFIELEPNFSFFKFLILQSYKFILLILASIYLRFCVYYIDTIFLNIRNPTSEAFNEELIQYNGGFFYNLISFMFYNIRNENEIFEKKSAFIPYLYLPINEIILFIIGIAIISLGYKFKLRFDIIIIISFILIYLFKIILFIAYLYRKQFYSTLYFFLYGYGVLMLNPIFNLPSFLIGMYFGLVNFTIQRGINDINEDDKNNFELLDKEQYSPLSENNENKEEEKNKIDLRVNTFSENNKVYGALTFYRHNTIIFKKEEMYQNTKKKKSFDEIYEKTKKNYDINMDMTMENNDIMTEMPFLKSTINFTNFHRKNQDKKILKIILAIFIILILSFIFVRYIFIYTNISKEIKKLDKITNEPNSSDINNTNVKRITDILSLEDLLPNLFLNILYVIDIELVVLMINLIFFYLYFKGGQINDFLSHIYWSFFIKSYFSYTLVSGLVILYILYQSETIFKVNIYTIMFYSLISSFFIFIAVIIFYSCYEYPLKKIFKTLKIRRYYINLDDDEYSEEENENMILK